MKPGTFRGQLTKGSYIPAITLAAVLLAGGCLEDKPQAGVLTNGPSMTGVATNAAVGTNAAVSSVTGAPMTASGLVTNNAVPVNIPLEASAMKVSSEVLEIAKLAQAGVSFEVMTNYLAKVPYAYNLTADEIVYLNDVGMPAEVIGMMIRKRPSFVEVASGAEPATAPVTTMVVAPTIAPPATTPPSPAPAVEAPAPVTAAPPAPAPEPVAAQPAPITVVDNSYFYNSLAPYGSWYYVEDYGYCWRPNLVAVSPGWQPYSHGGRWVYTTSGWYWQSDYTWGWAPFHYGRWYRHSHHGWMWQPGAVWGPAWVSWRTSADYCGWAPLPPAACYTSGIGFSYHGRNVGVSFEFGLGLSSYTWIGWGHFNDRNPHHYYAPATHHTTIYNNSTVINNYVTGNNNSTVINNGIGTAPISRATRQEIKPVAVRDAAPGASQAGQYDRVVRSGSEAVIYRPRADQVTAFKPANSASANSSAAGLVRSTERPAIMNNRDSIKDSVRSSVAAKPLDTGSRPITAEKPGSPLPSVRTANPVTAKPTVSGIPAATGRLVPESTTVKPNTGRPGYGSSSETKPGTTTTVKPANPTVTTPTPSVEKPATTLPTRPTARVESIKAPENTVRTTAPNAASVRSGYLSTESKPTVASPARPSYQVVQPTPLTPQARPSIAPMARPKPTYTMPERVVKPTYTAPVAPTAPKYQPAPTPRVETYRPPAQSTPVYKSAPAPTYSQPTHTPPASTPTAPSIKTQNQPSGNGQGGRNSDRGK
jgi:hypothetical protein